MGGLDVGQEREGVPPLNSVACLPIDIDRVAGVYQVLRETLIEGGKVTVTETVLPKPAIVVEG